MGDGLLFKLTALNFTSYLVKTISSYLHNRTFEESFQTATSTPRVTRAGVAQGGLISSVLFSLYVSDMPVPSRHVELALYGDDTAIIATSRSLALLVSYLEAYLIELDRWLRVWRIAITVSKSNSMLFAKTGWWFSKPRPVQLLGEPIQLVDTARYLGVILDTRITWSPHIVQVKKKAAQRLNRSVDILRPNSGKVYTESCLAPKTRHFSNIVTEVLRDFPQL